MARWVTHSHDDGQPFRSARAYELSKRCSKCGASEGQDCVVLGHTSFDGTHAVRAVRAGNHRNRDVGAAPWPEDQVPGVCYSTLPDCG